MSDIKGDFDLAFGHEALPVGIVIPEAERSGLFSFSQLSSWDRCRFAWHLGYKLGWTPEVKKKALERGSFWHELMAAHYAEWSQEQIDEVIQNYLDPSTISGQTIQIVDQCTWLFDQYKDWAHYADLGQETLAVEYHFELDFETPKGRTFLLQGYVDHIYEEDGKVWCRDHKSYTRTPISPIEAMMDPQMPVYAFALRRLGFEPFGIEFNQANMYEYKNRDEVTPDKLFKRERTYRTPAELDAITKEVGRQVDDLLDNQDNPRRSLKRDCRMCQFQDPCLMNLKGIPLEDSFAMGDWRKKESYS